MTELVRTVGGSCRGSPGESVLISIIEGLDVYRRVLSTSELRKTIRGFTSTKAPRRSVVTQRIDGFKIPARASGRGCDDI